MRRIVRYLKCEISRLPVVLLKVQLGYDLLIIALCTISPMHVFVNFDVLFICTLFTFLKTQL